MSEFKNGARYARDCILSSIIGLQNNIIHDGIDNTEYRAYQKVYNLIVKNYGDMFKEFKG